MCLGRSAPCSDLRDRRCPDHHDMGRIYVKVLAVVVRELDPLPEEVAHGVVPDRGARATLASVHYAREGYLPRSVILRRPAGSDCAGWDGAGDAGRQGD